MGRWLLRLTSLLLSFAVIAGVVLAWGWIEFTKPGPLDRPINVVIPRGAGLDGIAARLFEAGVIADRRILVLGAKATGRARGLKAGEFRFAARLSPREVLDVLESGQTVVRRLTVAEGLSSAAIITLLNSAEGLDGTLDTIPPEGGLLPETYHYAWGDARTELLRRMAGARSETLTRLWAGRAEGLPYDTPEQALILASIVEKETGVADERPLIAGVFVNRLKRGMRLQSDPTVAYGIAGGAGLGRPLTHADLKRPTPYNTYTQDGLPQGPICNPGAEAIAAVLNPAQTDFLYFVADGTGGHAFARTLAEHNRNVRAWRRYQRNQNQQ